MANRDPRRIEWRWRSRRVGPTRRPTRAEASLTAGLAGRRTRATAGPLGSLHGPDGRVSASKTPPHRYIDVGGGVVFWTFPVPQRRASIPARPSVSPPSPPAPRPAPPPAGAPERALR